MASGNKRRYFFWEVCQTRSTTLTNPKTHHQLSVFFYAHWPTHPFASTAPPSVFRLGQPNFPWSFSPIDASLHQKVLQPLRHVSRDIRHWQLFPDSSGTAPSVP